jgi:hypothetical protein
MFHALTPKYFTPEEADGALPEVEKRLREVTIANEAVESLKEDLERAVEEDSTMLEFVGAKMRLNKAMTELHRSIEYLEDMGCTMKDVEHGLVDFPAKRFGEEVWLCWRVGESKVMYWHGKQEGFTLRKPLEADVSGLT